MKLSSERKEAIKLWLTTLTDAELLTAATEANQVCPDRPAMRKFNVWEKANVVRPRGWAWDEFGYIASFIRWESRKLLTTKGISFEPKIPRVNSGWSDRIKLPSWREHSFLRRKGATKRHG